MCRLSPTLKDERMIEITVIDEVWGQIGFGANYGNDWDQDRAVADQLYAQMLGWA